MWRVCAWIGVAVCVINLPVWAQVTVAPDVEAGRPQPMARVAPAAEMTGSLRVDVNAPGAKVVVNGREAGTASPEQPLTLQELPAGSVKVEVSAAGYATKAVEVDVKAGEPARTTIELEATSTETPKTTVVRDEGAKQKLLGKHMFSLQWISWDYFGEAKVVDDNGLLRITGRQDSRENSDFVTIDGVIESVDAREFAFVGKIVTQVSYINDGKPCERDGKMTFRITGSRKYWRLAQIDNPCDEVADYVDIYF